MMQREITDEDIRRILDTDYRYMYTDYWEWLEDQTEDPKLKERIRDRWRRAYHAEEYFADML